MPGLRTARRAAAEEVHVVTVRDAAESQLTAKDFSQVRALQDGTAVTPATLLRRGQVFHVLHYEPCVKSRSCHLVTAKEKKYSCPLLVISLQGS